MSKDVGLIRGTVTLVSHNPNWKSLYRKEESVLSSILGKNVHIEHIGSTAIPGISAKPAIDVMVGIPQMRTAQKYIRLLEAKGYSWRKKFGRIDQNAVLAKGSDRSRSHYIHIVRYNGTIWKDKLLFRDYLLRNASSAHVYDSLKRRLEKTFANDRPSYTAQKTEFVRSTLNKARKA